MQIPDIIDRRVEVMLPFQDKTVRKINLEFYRKYYTDNRERIFLIGINPGRFGGGVTGIPFTDPVNLLNKLLIKNTFQQKHELSSQFIYRVIDGIGGVEKFFRNFYLTAVSPVGFVSKNKNVNYYEVREIKDDWEMFFKKCLDTQISAGGRKDIAFILGMGENKKYFEKFNDKYRFFEKLIAFPHPRWVMQYRFRQKQEFIDQYVSNLLPFIYSRTDTYFPKP